MNSPASSPLLIEHLGPVARLTLNNPERRNPLGRPAIAALSTAFDAIATDPTVRVVVLAAAGPVFCAGHDLSQMVGRDEAEYRALFSECAEMMLKIRQLPQPVIARVQGMATAAGCQLVATCDLAVASRTAQFAAPGLKIGLFCTTPMVPLMRAVPAKAALEMLLTAEPISAERALAIGLINRVVEPEQLDAAVDELTGQIARGCPEIVALGKRAFYRQQSLDEVAAYGEAVELITANALRPEAQEGIAAFLQRRAPRWGGT
jgi:enoyl-CoA hydratase/carnithine racemase